MPTTAGPWDLGDVVPLGVSITNASGAAADATAVTVTITLPDGSTSTPSVTHAGTGSYTASYTPTTVGLHVERWVATGTNASSYLDSFVVESSTVPGIIGLADLQGMSRNTTSADEDTQRAVILAASELCERHTQVWRRQTVVRTFDVPCGRDRLVLRRPVLSVTSVVENGVTLASTEYTLNTEDGLLYRGGTRTPWTWLEGRQIVTVTYVAGATSIPEPVREGVKELSLYLLASYRGGSGLPRANAESFASFRDLPNKVQMLWAPYTPVLVA